MIKSTTLLPCSLLHKLRMECVYCDILVVVAQPLKDILLQIVNVLGLNLGSILYIELDHVNDDFDSLRVISKLFAHFQEEPLIYLIFDAAWILV